jgi:hypothetical protein
MCVFVLQYPQYFSFDLSGGGPALSLLRVVPFLLFLMVGMMLLVFGFEPFVLGLYCGGALRAVTLPVGLKLFDGLDYFVSSLRPACAYESFSEVLRHLPPQLVVEVVFLHRR